MIYNSDINDLFKNFFNNPKSTNFVTLKTNISDNENYEINQTTDGAYLFFDAPGFNKSTLKVEIENGVLYINGIRKYKIDGEEKEKTINKQFRIGDNYNPELIEATIEDGLLTVFVPNFKKQEKKRISII